MWIRTQSKDMIVNANTFHLYFFDPSSVWIISADNISVGRFKTEKQAKKVMDTIHQHIEMHPNQVYNIPKDSTII